MQRLYLRLIEIQRKHSIHDFHKLAQQSHVARSPQCGTSREHTLLELKLCNGIVTVVLPLHQRRRLFSWKDSLRPVQRKGESHNGKPIHTHYRPPQNPHSSHPKDQMILPGRITNTITGLLWCKMNSSTEWRLGNTSNGFARRGLMWSFVYGLEMVSLAGTPTLNQAKEVNRKLRCSCHTFPLHQPSASTAS